jgi:diguanylate cyclase (GGDEF)-like protein
MKRETRVLDIRGRILRDRRHFIAISIRMALSEIIPHFMKDDIRYAEFLFLCALARRDPRFEYIFVNSLEQQNLIGVGQIYYAEMTVALAENGYIIFEQQNLHLLIGRLRDEIAPSFSHPSTIQDYEWLNPRDALQSKLFDGNSYRLRVTYRGLCRIEELRELLKRDRILEPFGVLLDIRYFLRDLEDALRRSADTPVSVVRFDMDHFKKINDNFGHHAGDVVMKSYLEAVRDSLGSVGAAYRGRGDEVVCLLIGLNHKRAVETTEKIWTAVAAMRCKFNGVDLPSVTASVGVATSPPESRGIDLDTLADHRQNRAKNEGKNCVITA